MVMREMSRTKLTKKLNKLLYLGGHDEALELIHRYPTLTRACIPYLASDGFRKTIRMLLEQGKRRCKASSSTA